MSKLKFISSLDDFYMASDKMGAVKFLLDTNVIGGLRDSKLFIDDFWFPSKGMSSGENVYFNLSEDQKNNLK